MTTEEMMEFYKNAWDKERENSNRLCMLKDEAIEKVLCLQEQLREANNIIVKADWDCDYTLQSKCGFSDYLKKYNIRGIK